MPPKKKGSEGGSSGKKDQEENLTEKLYRAYRRKLNELELPMPKSMEEKFSELRNDKEPGDLIEVCMWENIGSQGIRALADALKETEYQLLRSFRLWKTFIEDEGCRAIVQFLTVNMTVYAVELAECGLTPLSCEFFSNLLGPEFRSPLIYLKLDHNNLGDEGLISLGVGLSQNTVLQDLSLTYCNIGPRGAEGFFETLIYVNCGLKKLDLQGNFLMNEGVCTILHALKVNTSLDSLNLVDNQFGEDPQVLTRLAEAFHNNSTLTKLDLLHNGIYNRGAEFILNALMEVNDDGSKKNMTLNTLRLPEKVTLDMIEEIQSVIASNRGKRGKKGKKGKKKG